MFESGFTPDARSSVDPDSDHDGSVVVGHQDLEGEEELKIEVDGTPPSPYVSHLCFTHVFHTYVSHLCFTPMFHNCLTGQILTGLPSPSPARPPPSKSSSLTVLEHSNMSLAKANTLEALTRGSCSSLTCHCTSGVDSVSYKKARHQRLCIQFILCPHPALYLAVPFPVHGQDPGRNDVAVAGGLHFLDVVTPGQGIEHGEQPETGR